MDEWNFVSTGLPFAFGILLIATARYNALMWQGYLLKRHGRSWPLPVLRTVLRFAGAAFIAMAVLAAAGIVRFGSKT